MTGAASEIRVAGIRSPLLTAGPGDRHEAVVFVHGNPGSSQDWSDLVHRVGSFAPAVAVDMACRPVRRPHV